MSYYILLSIAPCGVYSWASAFAPREPHMKKSVLSIACTAVLALSTLSAHAATVDARGGSDPRPQARGGSDPRPQSVATTTSSFGLLVSVVMTYLGL